jgi:uncharacterized repeat protein (TIGR01451 family)
MSNHSPKTLRLGLAILVALLLLLVVMFTLRSQAPVAHARSTDLHPGLGPARKVLESSLPATGTLTATHVILPPHGYPILDQSTKTVTPTLANTGGETLHYVLELRNTGAWTATNAILTDDIPDNTTYNDDAQASNGVFHYDAGVLTWQGEVGFDSTVAISFSVSVSSGFSGTLRNLAVLNDPLLVEPVTMTAETIVTDMPLLAIGKMSDLEKPGANKPLTYTLVITNLGQPATSLPVTVTDWVPAGTTLRELGSDGSSASGDVVTWTRNVTLDTGETSVFTFSVDVADVPSGTIISNQTYQVANAETGVTLGEPYTVTVIDPVLLLHKETWPDPPGSNREMTYTLTVLNRGSLATNLVITDRVPAGVTYERGGSLQPGNVVSWTWPSLATDESAQFTFVVSIGDVAEVSIVNDDYAVCSAEGVCQPGNLLSRVIQPATFEAIAILDPIAKKPGGGGGPVTPTLVVRNLGPGNALNATALLQFEHISINNVADLEVLPSRGTLSNGPYCGEKCYAYLWIGDLAYGDVITFMPTLKQGSRGRSTIVGEEGTIYTATVVITDSVSNMTTEPVTGTATGRITHYANLIPTKYGPPVVGPGQLLTYIISVWNSALSAEGEALLTDTLPSNTTFVSASDGGVTQTVSNTTVVSWTLPALSTGETLTRSLTLRVDSDVVSGTQIINSDYGVSWETTLTDTIAISSNVGLPVTTTVREVGLIDSYKEVTPQAVAPGDVLTYVVHIVNSSNRQLTGVTVEDLLPWQLSTYQRDAGASGGAFTEEDIVSIHWQGDLAPFSSESITFSVVTRPGYEGLITNTAIISHPELLAEIERHAVAYVTTKPVLLVSKSASPNPVSQGGELLYTIRVEVLGQRATELTITDTIPAGTDYVVGSATAGGVLVGDEVKWQILAIEPGDSRSLAFRVKVNEDTEVINSQYGVRSAEGAVGVGVPIVTTVRQVSGGDVYLPIIQKNG